MNLHSLATECNNYRRCVFLILIDVKAVVGQSGSSC